MNSKQNKKANKQSAISNQPATTQTELLNRTEQSTTATASEKTLNSELSTNNPTTPSSIKPYVNFAERDFNRSLPVDQVLEKLKRWMPAQYQLAEVIGKWIWITFPEPPIERVRAELSQLGFHWNNARKCWQHPCGETLPRGTEEPREKYSFWFPRDISTLRQKKSEKLANAARTNLEQAAN